MPALPKFNSAAASAADTAVAASTSSPERRGGQPVAPFHILDQVVIHLPMPPTTNNLFAGTGKRRYRTSEYNDWIREAGLRMNRQHPPQTLARVSILIEVEEPRTARRMDLANREKAVCDLLVAHSLIQGDDQFYVRELNMRWASDIEGVRVTIKPLASVAGGAGV